MITNQQERTNRWMQICRSPNVDNMDAARLPLNGLTLEPNMSLN